MRTAWAAIARSPRQGATAEKKPRSHAEARASDACTIHAALPCEQR